MEFLSHYLHQNRSYEFLKSAQLDESVDTALPQLKNIKMSHDLRILNFKYMISTV